MPEPRPRLPRRLQAYATLKHFAILAALLAVLGFVLFFLTHRQLRQSERELVTVRQEVEELSKNPTARIGEENKQLIAQVGQLVVLPTDEEPTIATVTDLAKLQDQPFFAQAQIGDKVLIYNNAKKAILYRPSTNKVIAIAPLTIGANSAAEAPTAPLSIAVLNGSGISGRAKQTADKLGATGYVVGRVGDATNSNYAKTVIQYKSGKEKEADALNQILGGGATLELSSSISEDLVVIVGKN